MMLARSKTFALIGSTLLCIACRNELEGPKGDKRITGARSSDYFTLEIIFYGLIAVVPRANFRELTAFSVDGSLILGHEHRALLIQTRGTCEGGCYHALSERFPGSSEKLAAAIAEHGYSSTLYLKGRELSIVNALPIVNKGIEFDRKLTSFPAEPYGLEWVPRMEEISEAFKKAKASCQKQDPSLGGVPCPIASRFRIRGWDDDGAISCHLVHDKEKDVWPYAFLRDGQLQGEKPYAMADAFSLRWTLKKADYTFIRFETRKFADPNSDNYVRLTPDRYDVLQVIFWNQPVELNTTAEARRHFGAYFKVSENTGTGEDRFPRRQSGARPNLYLGSCESLFSSIDKSISASAQVWKVFGLTKRSSSWLGQRSVPHNIRECDAVIFSN